MGYLNNKPISNCRLPLTIQQFICSILLMLACGLTNGQNTPGFFISETSGCGHLNNVYFYEASDGDPVVNRHWDLGNGTIIPNGPDVVSTSYTNPGTYYVSLTATFANGDVLTHTDSVRVFDKATVSIEGESTVCLTADKRLQYTANIVCADPIAGYKWQIDADSVAGTPNLDHIYRIPGTHMLQLTVTTIGGCKYIATKTFVVDYIATYFGMSTGRYCGSGTVTFSNYSINIYPLQSWQWSYGDGSTFNGREQSHTYTAPGDYTVKLVATSITGCKDSTVFKDTVKILTVPTATINGPSLICLKPDTRLNYTSSISTVDVIRQYKWAIDGSTVASVPNLNTVFTEAGNHELSFNIKTSKGCENTVTRTITIDSVKTSFGVSAARLCGGGDVTFTNLSKNAAPATYRWTFGDGSSFTGKDTVHAYPNIGSYAVQLFGETINGCKDSTYLTDSIKVFHQPVVSISGPGMLCLTPATRLQYSSSINSTDAVATYKWTIDNDSVANTAQLNINYRKPGNHNIRFEITTVNGCSAFATASFMIDSVKTSFAQNATTLCSPGSIVFSNQSKSALANTAYTWQFGDDSSYIGKDTAHYYSSPGIYPVKLLAITANGCKDSMVLTPGIKILQELTAGISGNNIICLTPASRLQYNSSNNGADAIVKHKWLINADSVANTAYLNINYRKPGTHTLTYIAVSTTGCVATASKSIIIDSVKTGILPDAVRFCGSGTVQFTNLSATASATTYNWQFGDGSNDTGNNATHTYTQTGSYTIKLFAETSNGCTDSTILKDSIKVFAQPTVDIQGDNVVCLTPSSTLLYNSIINSADAIAQYKWFIDSDSIANTIHLNNSYRQAGTHTLRTEIKSINGCTAFAEKNIIIDSVKAAFIADKQTLCGNGEVYFTNNSTAASAAQYHWQFGDGAIANDFDATHYYTNTGSYIPALVAITQNGCTDSTSDVQGIMVATVPKVKIIGDTLHCQPGNYQYKLASTAIESLEEIQWQVNGIPAGSTTQIEQYFHAGNYTITARGTTINGCADSAAILMIVDSVKAAFSLAQQIFCADSATVAFSNQSAAFSTIKNYYWSFGDGNSAATAITANSYMHPGTYDVQLIATTVNGCSDTTALNNAVNIHRMPIASIKGDSLHCSTGSFIYIADESHNENGTVYTWTVNNTPAANTALFQYDFILPGTYNLQLTATAGNGCTTSTLLPVVIDTVKAVFTAGNTLLCSSSGDVALYNHSVAASGILAYKWQFGDGQTGNTGTVAHTYMPGRYVPSLTVTTVNGCTASYTLPDTIAVINIQAAITGDADKCSGSTASYFGAINGNDDIVSYNWKLNGSSIGSNATVTCNFVHDGNYNLQLTATTAKGCMATAIKNITVHPLPTVHSTGDTTVCKGSALQLYSSGGTTYQWQPAALLQQANTATAVLNNAIEGIYTVTVTNAYGCSSYDTITIKTDEPVQLSLSGNTTICTGSSTQLKATGNATSYLWNNAATLNNAGIASPIATPATTTTYQVTGFSGNSCKNDTASITVLVGSIPQLDAGPAITTEANATVNLHATASTNEAQYNWWPADGLSCSKCSSPSFTAVKDIAYTVTVSTPYGCTASDTVFVKVNPARAKLLMANAFSPNNDGLNDYFYVKGYGLITVKHMIIFNRLGQKVFERYNVPANDPRQGWNGQINGAPAGDNESFVYILSVIDKDGQELQLKGTVLIVR